ncbi:hypothetical protein [Sphaerimonospora thailandensis]|uniref:Uncharacterized protein n=1 Tax=Sphaerimonospora thailandensis TaxID=795644 RepID=A0A8J3VXI5_9ACTN|nr:hypothetical protein [Sphaerimonospora thailandensis]GIH68989.1 hypothetical protein Mth01_12420 [Sphaerimonospora thailandensis]
MGPELHYQMIMSRTAELRQEAARQRLAREARAARKGGEPSGGERHRSRAVFGKLRTS